MTDERPRPKYGEYADVPPAPAPAPATIPTEAVEPEPTVTRPRRTWDLVLSTALLLWGVFDVVTGFPAYARLGTTVATAAEQQGFGGFASVDLADEVGSWLNIVRVVILVVAILGTLWRLARGRLAFWVPLSAGGLAVAVVVVSVFVILVGDPGFAAFVAGQTAP
jgi:hypothetical protein